MLNVGVIGLGAMGQHHVRLYSQLGCNLVGVADSDLERAKLIGEKYQAPYFQDYHELLNKVEAVSIAVPTTLHHLVAMDFLNTGVHCLVEKPIAASIEEAEDMIRAAQNHKVRLAIGHIERFNPAVTKLKEIIDQGLLGDPLIIIARRVGPSSPRIRDVGVVIDSATHDIGVVKYLIGKNPVSIFSRVSSMNHPKEDQAVIVLDFGDARACLEANWLTPNKVRTLVVTGSNGIAYLDYIEQSIMLYDSNGIREIPIEKDEPLKLEVKDFISSIKNGTSPEVDGAEGLEVLKIALSASVNNYIETWK